MAGFVLRPAAVADIRKAYRWYQAERPGLGEEFLEAVGRAAERAAARPAGHAVIYRDTRRIVVRRFPYGLFFRILDGTVVFVACYHLRRRPASWKRRR